MTRRTQRVGESMREVLGELLQRELKDPRVGFVTITAVRVTPDLSKADVYYTVLGDEEARAQTQKGLDSATPFLRTEVGRRVRLKSIPELRFTPDEAVDHGQRVDELLHEIHLRERGGREEEPIQLPPVDPEVQAGLEASASVLLRAGEVGVACHVSPDGDALGSILGLGLVLEGLGKRVTAGWGSEVLEVAAPYAFLPGLELLREPARFRPGDAAVAIDCASEDRLELLEAPLRSAPTLLNIDHHVSNTRFGGLDVIDPAAPSSSELVLRLILEMDVEITPPIALCLYTGLATDTGRFTYESATPRAHVAAALLVGAGARPEVVSQAIYESMPYGYLKVLGQVLERCRLLTDPPLVVSYLARSDLEHGGITLDDTEELINVLRSSKEADVSVLLKETNDGRWKGSLRSKGATDVSEIAKRFGGGGHRLAAGFTSEYPLEESIALVHERLRAHQVLS